MPKITQGGGPSFDPTQPVDPGEAADPRSPVTDPNAARERPGEDGTGFAKYADTNEVEYEGRSPEPEVEPETYEGDAWSKEALQHTLQNRGLPISGTKPELAERLRQSDRAAAGEDSE